MNFRAHSYKSSAGKLCSGIALAISICAPVHSAPDIKSGLSASAKTDSSFQSCKTLISCVDILERHTADSFDYAVLAQDFERFGDKSRSVLWRIIDAGQAEDAKADILANRALDILSRWSKILPPPEQRRIVELWKTHAAAPYMPEFLAQIMVTNLSPMVRSTAIHTLESENTEVADMSRAILSTTLQRGMKFTMQPADFAPLSRAALSTPSPDLAALVALYPPKTAAPVLAQILKSGDTPSVIAAYAALYENNPESAFKALVSTLYGLGADSVKAGNAIGGLLAHRHSLREDGFYMSFASELSNDPEMSPAGRAAGFAALLRRQGGSGVAVIKDTPAARANYALALTAFLDGPTPPDYYTLPLVMPSETADIWLKPLRAAVSTPEDEIALIEVAGNFNTGLARAVATKGLSFEGDYRVTIASILAKAAQASSNDQAALQELSTLGNHPYTIVRAASILGREAIQTKAPRKAVLKLQSELSKRAAELDTPENYCEIKAVNLRDMARAMPYYNPAALPGRVKAERAWFTSGSRVNGGWLAGYSRPRSGGLVSYSNESGLGVELFAKSPFGPQAVIAVQPTQPVPLGQTAEAFWVFATSLNSGESALYRAAQMPNKDFTLTRHAVLPAQPTSIQLSPRGDINFAMGRINPPLTLSANGALRRACAPQG